MLIWIWTSLIQFLATRCIYYLKNNCTMIELVFGLHENVSGSTPFVIYDTKRNDVNGELEQLKTLFPSQWGRYPLPIVNSLSMYKAETFKLCIMHFAVPIMYSLYSRSSSNLKVWIHFRNVVEIASNATPHS